MNFVDVFKPAFVNASVIFYAAQGEIRSVLGHSAIKQL